MDGSAFTTDDIQNLIVMCGDGKVRRLAWGDLLLEFFGAEGESDSDDEKPLGFTTVQPAQVSIPMTPDDEDGYSKLFGGQKPRFKKPSTESSGG